MRHQTQEPGVGGGVLESPACGGTPPSLPGMHVSILARPQQVTGPGGAGMEPLLQPLPPKGGCLGVQKLRPTPPPSLTCPCSQSLAEEGTGLLLSERLINCPPAVAPPLQQALREDLQAYQGKVRCSCTGVLGVEPGALRMVAGVTGQWSVAAPRPHHEGSPHVHSRD